MKPTWNPVARLGGAMLLGTPLLLTIDWVSATVSLAFSIAAAIAFRFPARRMLPVLFLAPLAGISMALYGRPGGQEYLSFGFAHVTENSVSLAIAVMLRVFAIALPVMVLMDRVDPIDLGDALIQILHLPQRFVIGAVAGLRMFGLLSRDYQSLRRARRTRGIADRSRFKRAFGLMFGLLVSALRRGTKLAVAMEARGFGDGPRTWARTSKLDAHDWLLMLACLGIAAISIAVAVLTGEFRFLGA